MWSPFWLQASPQFLYRSFYRVRFSKSSSTKCIHKKKRVGVTCISPSSSSKAPGYIFTLEWLTTLHA